MARPESSSARPMSQYQLACQVSGEELSSGAGPSPDVLDAELIQQALSGAFESFERLVTRYERKAFWIAFHVLGRVEDSRDSVQEAFVRVYRSLDRFDFSKNFYTWLYRIVTNLAIDKLRKIRSEKVVQLEDGGDSLLDEEATVGNPEGGLAGKELSTSVRTVLDQIAPRFRTILALRDLHGISCREIAPILGLTYATVRWRLHKARQIFKEHWERTSRSWQD